MKLKTLILTLESDRQIKEDAAKLRGFFASKFNEYVLLHQHNTDRLIYGYPLVQYKMIDGVPMVVGVNEGAEVLKEIYDKFDVIRLGDSVHEIVERGISIQNVDFGLSDKIHSYEFVSPWLALNHRNYERYFRLDRSGQKNLLRRTLVGNILSMAKGLDYVVTSQIKLDVGRVRHNMCTVKGVNMLGVECDFMVNFAIPDFLGLGKSVSRGFGVVRRVVVGD